MLGFEIGFWDFITFIAFFVLVIAVVIFFVLFAGLPGRIAIARKHPESESLKLMGWAGLLPTIYPWVEAFIWAFKPTNVVDIRRYPQYVLYRFLHHAWKIKTSPNILIERHKGSGCPGTMMTSDRGETYS
jgi:hypothetical protein